MLIAGWTLAILFGAGFVVVVIICRKPLCDLINFDEADGEFAEVGDEIDFDRFDGDMRDAVQDINFGSKL
jgi:hypothetical protein